MSEERLDPGSEGAGATAECADEGSGVVRSFHPADAALAVLAVAVQSFWMVQRYPAAHLDADLLSYLAYFREWWAGSTIQFGYTVPKVLPVVLLGPLGDPALAQVVSIAVASLGAGLVVALLAPTLGRPAALVGAALYVFDPLRSVLTIRSSVDMYMGVAVLAAMVALQSRAVVVAGLLLLVAALGKPVAVACAGAILLVPGVPIGRRLLGAAIPALALPATAALDAALIGQPVLPALLSLSLPDHHQRFVQVAQAAPMEWTAALHLIVVEWFGGLLFAHSWPLVAGGVGIYLWKSLRGELGNGDRRAWILLTPGLLAAAYLIVSAIHPLVFFTRFFWLVSLVASLMAGLAIVHLLTQLPDYRLAGLALAGAMTLALAHDRLNDHRWRARIMLDPYETHAQIASRAVETIAADPRCRGDAVVPLAYLPLAAWAAPDKLTRGEICAVEDWADGRGCGEPRCVLFIPRAPTTGHAREALVALVANGQATEIADAHGILVRPRG